jgi:hypothetical protein
MFVVMGRFRFRPMEPGERQGMFRLWAEDFAPMVRGCHGFQSVRFVQLSDDEVMTDWHWDSEADWEAAQASYGPFLQDQVAPQLAQPPERYAGDVALEITP